MSQETVTEKQAQRIVDTLLDKMNDYAELKEVGATSSLRGELVALVLEVLAPEFDEIYEDFESSNISAIMYNPFAEVLQIDFKGGGRYRYYGVEPDKYNILVEAESKGKCFNYEIKSNYPFLRM